MPQGGIPPLAQRCLSASPPTSRHKTMSTNRAGAMNPLPSPSSIAEAGWAFKRETPLPRNHPRLLVHLYERPDRGLRSPRRSAPHLVTSKSGYIPKKNVSPRSMTFASRNRTINSFPYAPAPHDRPQSSGRAKKGSFLHRKSDRARLRPARPGPRTPYRDSLTRMRYPPKYGD